MIRVDILDSSPLFLIGLTEVLAGNGIRVVGARTSAAAPAEWSPVDVFLVDVAAVPDGATTHVAATARLGPTLVLVGTSPGRDMTDALIQAGAAGVVSKQEPAEKVVAAVRAAAAGQYPAGVAGSAGEEPDGAGQPTVLSRREEQVLHQIALGRTHAQIARQLGIRQCTVDTYVKRIRTKLGVGNKAELTRAAMLRALR